MLIISRELGQSLSAPGSAGASPGSDAVRKRGAALTGWLLFQIFAYLIIALAYVVWKPASLPAWRAYSYATLALALTGLSVLLFAWRKWAFYGQCIVAVIIFLLNITGGVNPASAALGFLGLVILYLLLRPKWSLLK